MKMTGMSPKASCLSLLFSEILRKIHFWSSNLNIVQKGIKEGFDYFQFSGAVNKPSETLFWTSTLWRYSEKYAKHTTPFTNTKSFWKFSNLEDRKCWKRSMRKHPRDSSQNILKNLKRSNILKTQKRGRLENIEKLEKLDNLENKNDLENLQRSERALTS